MGSDASQPEVTPAPERPAAAGGRELYSQRGLEPMAGELETIPPDTGLTPPAPARGLFARAQLITYIVVVVAILVVLNVLAVRHNKSWDLTKNHRHSLSQESTRIVQGLQHPLTLMYFDRTASFPHAQAFLDQYGRASNDVKVAFVDPDRHPDQARKYHIQNYGTLVAAYSGRTQTVQTLNEQDVTNAIVRVLKGSSKVVYFVEGEGERTPQSSGRNGYSDLRQALTSENFTVKTLVLAQSPAIPSDCSVLVVAGPTHALLPPEVSAISSYLQHGGRALFLLNMEASGPLLDYLQNSLNVQLTPDVVVDTSGIGRLFGASALMPIAAHYGSSPITHDMGQEATLFPFARTVEPGTSASSKAIVHTLVQTTPASYAVSHISGNRVRIDPRKDRHGPLPLAVAGTLPAPKKGAPEARFAVYGSPDFVSNAILGFNGNRDLVLNTMNWLSSQEHFITIRPKTPQNTPINLTARQMHIVFWFILVIFPLFVVAMGLLVWLKRRTA